MIFVLDNYDSFTYNLVQYFGILQQEVIIRRNDAISVSAIAKLNPNYIVISPGPCTPNKAGISIETIKYFKGKVPILGVCLGHQSIGQAFGAKIVRAKKIMHGKLSQVHHDQTGIFKGVKNPVTVTRYHSLVIDRPSFDASQDIDSKGFVYTSWTQTASGEFDEIMGIRNSNLAIEGVQFHPESILTDEGMQMCANFLDEFA